MKRPASSSATPPSRRTGNTIFVVTLHSWTRQSVKPSRKDSRLAPRPKRGPRQPIELFVLQAQREWSDSINFHRLTEKILGGCSLCETTIWKRSEAENVYIT